MNEACLPINAVFEIDSREGVWKAVEQGLGISIVADFEYVAHPNLHSLEIEDHVIRTQYSIAFHKARSHSPLIKAFMKIVDEMRAG
jgi:DNA-binding transcriptional LysR family regulator